MVYWKASDNFSTKNEVLNGFTMKGVLKMGGNYIGNLAGPRQAQDAATKRYVDKHDSASGHYLPLAGGVLSGELSMGNQKIINLAYGAKDKEAACVKYVKDHVASEVVDAYTKGQSNARYLLKAGGMLRGELLMSGQMIRDLGQLGDPDDAVPKNFLESSLNSYVLKSSKISYDQFPRLSKILFRARSS